MKVKLLSLITMLLMLPSFAYSSEEEIHGKVLWTTPRKVVISLKTASVKLSVSEDAKIIKDGKIVAVVKVTSINHNIVVTDIIQKFEDMDSEDQIVLDVERKVVPEVNVPESPQPVKSQEPTLEEKPKEAETIAQTPKKIIIVVADETVKEGDEIKAMQGEKTVAVLKVTKANGKIIHAEVVESYGDISFTDKLIKEIKPEITPEEKKGITQKPTEESSKKPDKPKPKKGKFPQKNRALGLALFSPTKEAFALKDVVTGQKLITQERIGQGSFVITNTRFKENYAIEMDASFHFYKPKITIGKTGICGTPQAVGIGCNPQDFGVEVGGDIGYLFKLSKNTQDVSGFYVGPILGAIFEAGDYFGNKGKPKNGVLAYGVSTFYAFKDKRMIFFKYFQAKKSQTFGGVDYSGMVLGITLLKTKH